MIGSKPFAGNNLRRWIGRAGAMSAVLLVAGCTSLLTPTPPEGSPPRPETSQPFPNIGDPVAPQTGSLLSPAEVAARQKALEAAGARARVEGGAIVGATRN